MGNSSARFSGLCFKAVRITLGVPARQEIFKGCMEAEKNCTKHAEPQREKSRCCEGMEAKSCQLVCIRGSGWRQRKQGVCECGEGPPCWGTPLTSCSQAADCSQVALSWMFSLTKWFGHQLFAQHFYLDQFSENHRDNLWGLVLEEEAWGSSWWVRITEKKSVSVNLWRKGS